MNKEPQRMCIACREHKSKKDLWRIVNYNGTVLSDPTGKAPGRGAYVCRSGACFSLAISTGRLGSHLKQSIDKATVADLQIAWQNLNSIDVEAKVLSLLGLGRRAKQLISGNQGVELAIKKQDAKLVIMAADAALNSVQNIKALCEAKAIPFYQIATKLELGRITGQSIRVVVAVIDADLAMGIEKLLSTDGKPC